MPLEELTSSYTDPLKSRFSMFTTHPYMQIMRHMINIQKSENTVLFLSISIKTVLNFAFYARDVSLLASRVLEAVLHEASAKTHETEVEAEARTREAKARFFVLEAEDKSRGSTSLIITKWKSGINPSLNPLSAATVLVNSLVSTSMPWLSFPKHLSFSLTLYSSLYSSHISFMILLNVYSSKSLYSFFDSI